MIRSNALIMFNPNPNPDPANSVPPPLDPSSSSSSSYTYTHSTVGGGVSPQLFVDLFVHMNSGIAPAEDVKLLGAEVWAGIARDASVSRYVGADQMLGKFLSRYDLWAVLTAELVC